MIQIHIAIATPFASFCLSLQAFALGWSGFFTGFPWRLWGYNIQLLWELKQLSWLEKHLLILVRLSRSSKIPELPSCQSHAPVLSSMFPAALKLLFLLSLQNHMSEMFAFHATMMSNTLGTPIVVFTRTGYMAILLSHYRPSGTIFAFTDEYVLFCCLEKKVLVCLLNYVLGNIFSPISLWISFHSKMTWLRCERGCSSGVAWKQQQKRLPLFL